MPWQGSTVQHYIMTLPPLYPPPPHTHTPKTGSRALVQHPVPAGVSRPPPWGWPPLRRPLIQQQAAAGWCVGGGLWRPVWQHVGHTAGRTGGKHTQV